MEALREGEKEIVREKDQRYSQGPYAFLALQNHDTLQLLDD